MAEKKIPVKSGPGLTPAADKLDALGLDAVCLELMSGGSLSAIARSLGISAGSVINWVEADVERSARVKAARTQSAKFWDEQAEAEIRMAGDPFELSKAKELAHHYRWRAKAVAPRDYGDKVTQEITGKDGGAVQVAAVDLRGLSDDELAQMQLLMSKAVGK